MTMTFEDFFCMRLFQSIPQLYEEPNGTQIMPTEPNDIILNSGLCMFLRSCTSTLLCCIFGLDYLVYFYLDFLLKIIYVHRMWCGSHC